MIIMAEPAARNPANRLRVTVYSIKKTDNPVVDSQPLGRRLIGEFDDGRGKKKLLAQKPETLGALLARNVPYGVLAEDIVISSITKGEAEDPAEAARGEERIPLGQEEIGSIQKAMMGERINITGVIGIIR